jgi:hypothetical protein
MHNYTVGCNSICDLISILPNFLYIPRYVPFPSIKYAYISRNLCISLLDENLYRLDNKFITF